MPLQRLWPPRLRDDGNVLPNRPRDTPWPPSRLAEGAWIKFYGFPSRFWPSPGREDQGRSYKRRGGLCGVVRRVHPQDSTRYIFFRQLPSQHLVITTSAHAISRSSISVSSTFLPSGRGNSSRAAANDKKPVDSYSTQRSSLFHSDTT